MRWLTDVAGRDREGASLRVVPDQVEHASPELVQVAGSVQPAGAAVLHQVEWPSSTGRDHRHSARERFLHGLAEGLVLSGVHEQVEAGHGLREGLAAQEAEEGRVRQQSLEGGAARPLPHDDQFRARDVGDRLEVLDLFLGGEAADVADDRLPAAARGRGASRRSAARDRNVRRRPRAPNVGGARLPRAASSAVADEEGASVRWRGGGCGPRAG